MKTDRKNKQKPGRQTTQKKERTKERKQNKQTSTKKERTTDIQNATNKISSKGDGRTEGTKH